MDDNNVLQLMLGTGVSAPKQEVQLYPIVKTAIENGIRYFDTAPSYKTERLGFAYVYERNGFNTRRIIYTE